MTKEEIIEMARQAGLPEAIIEMTPIAFERFAKLIAVKEREECAKLVESSIYDWKIDATNPHEWDELAIDLSIAIVNRTRGQDAST